MKIGLGITTHNRSLLFKETYRRINRFLPDNAKLVVVDDGSRHKVREATFRFEKPQGVAVAKNKCFQLLEDCDYIFTFDDDVYPIKKNWHLPFIEAYKETECNHFSLTWEKFSDGSSNGNEILETKGNIQSFKFSQGVMMFFTKRCLEVAGGFDTNYGRYGFEHWDLSRRIFNLGLTPFRFCALSDTMKYFHSKDHQKSIRSTMIGERRKLAEQYQSYYDNQFNSKEFKPYK